MKTDLPGNWETTPGVRNGENQYTHFFNNPETGKKVRKFSDPGQPHQVMVIGEDGYVEYSRTFPTEEDAENALNQILIKFSDL